jgi:hypothetical protein
MQNDWADSSELKAHSKQLGSRPARPLTLPPQAQPFWGWWLVPALATLGFPLLLLHKTAESAVVLGMYSPGYALCLLLVAANIAFLWVRPLPLSAGEFVAGIVIIGSLAFLYDFAVGLRFISVYPSQMIVALAACLIAQTRLAQTAASYVRRRLTRAQFSIADAALLAGGLVFAIVLTEGLLRDLFLQRLTPHTQREFASLMSTFWPKPISIAKEDGTVRILGVADSMGVVGGADENYYYVAERKLRDAVPKPVQMVNVSVTGYEPRHELNILRFGMQYHPDIVLHSFFVGNDFTLYGEDTWEVRGIRINDEPGEFRYRPRNFFLADLVTSELAYRKDLHQVLYEKRTGAVDQVGYLSKAFFLRMQLGRMRFFKESTVADMKAVFPILDSIRKAAAAGNATYVMVINPDQTQVDLPLRRELLTSEHLNSEDYDFDLPQRVMQSYCTSAGIACLDLLPVFRAVSSGGDLYTTRDGHYSKKGNQAAGEAITRFLLERKLLPPSTDSKLTSR